VKLCSCSVLETSRICEVNQQRRGGTRLLPGPHRAGYRTLTTAAGHSVRPALLPAEALLQPEREGGASLKESRNCDEVLNGYDYSTTPNVEPQRNLFKGEINLSSSLRFCKGRGVFAWLLFV